MTRSVPLLALTLLSATMLAGCSRSEPVDTFKPDRAEEKVAVTDTKAKGAEGAKTTAAASTVAPQDQCAKDPSFVAYRDKLSAAIKAKSFDQLKPLVDPQIKLDFGGGAGVDTLGERLAATPTAGADAAESKNLWAELADVMALGCTLEEGGNGAIMPFAYTALDASNRDAFTTYFPRRDNVELLKAEPAADQKGEVAKMLRWDILTLAAENADFDKPYVAVKLDDGTTGVVKTADIRSLVDYRAFFTKSADGNWLLSTFIAGD